MLLRTRIFVLLADMVYLGKPNMFKKKDARQIVKPLMKLNFRVPVDLLENALYTGKYARFVNLQNRYTFGEQKLRF